MARPVLRRLRAARDRLLLPEAAAGADQWQRVVLNRAVDERLGALGPASLSAVEISGDAQAARPWRRFESLNYPEFDLCAPLRVEARFDVVICEQVLEHVLDPCAAAANLRGLCVPGGEVIVSTPFLIRPHALPEYGMPDHWRFTPSGLRLLLEGAGLDVHTVGSWGNRSCVAGNLGHWPAHRRWLSLRNDPELPVQVWAFARNPA